MNIDWDVKDDLAKGLLQEILGEYAKPANSLQVVYQRGKAIPKRIRALIDALKADFINHYYTAEIDRINRLV